MPIIRRIMVRGKILCSMILLVISLVFICHGFSEAAHLEKIDESVQKFESDKDAINSITAKATPPNISVAATPLASITESDTLPCQYTAASATSVSLIQPDPGESIGDPVCVEYCYVATGSASASGTAFSAQAGTGTGAVDFTNCTTLGFEDPSTIILNPGSGQSVIFSDGPRNGSSFSTGNRCGRFQVKIGDTLQASVGAYALAVKGSGTGQAQAQATNSLDLQLTARSCVVATPTLTEWGMIIFMVLAGLGAVYYLRRQRRVES